LRALLPGRLKTMIDLAPERIHGPGDMDKPQVFAAQGKKRRRVALMTGCAQKVLRPAINEATVRLLTRHGCEVVIVKDGGCCGAVVQHLGQEQAARNAARTNIAAWMAEMDGAGLDAIVINASGCGTTVKDYGHMLARDAAWAEPAARIAGLTRDVTEVLADLGLGRDESQDLGQLDHYPVVAYHSACSMQHGQKLTEVPIDLLRAAGFEVRLPAEGHLCCGSAGTYNMLQPELAGQLQRRKVTRLQEQNPDVIATGNIGCLMHLAGGADVAVVHTVELLDWASGGPKPQGVE
jgi:glycolate oxidase iron-sulfur subunit